MALLIVGPGRDEGLLVDLAQLLNPPVAVGPQLVDALGAQVPAGLGGRGHGLVGRLGLGFAAVPLVFERGARGLELGAERHHVVFELAGALGGGLGHFGRALRGDGGACSMPSSSWPATPSNTRTARTHCLDWTHRCPRTNQFTLPGTFEPAGSDPREAILGVVARRAVVRTR
ncbi:hypothetical protein AB0F91_33125 [Amycolatopsis sp. NPDC023774]|uniref:hypothetical protein n=1 Tax=Amycolatopsis sp. NPDC023774 TaxID=3155015 RepID=UPI0033EA618A